MIKILIHIKRRLLRKSPLLYRQCFFNNIGRDISLLEFPICLGTIRSFLKLLKWWKRRIARCMLYFFGKNFEALLVQHLFKVILPLYFVQNFNLNHIALSEGNLLLGIRILLELMVAP